MRASDQTSTITLRPYRATNRARVTHLLHFLPSLYPNADRWLERRLSEVERGVASGTLAYRSRFIAGIMIEVPKGKRRTKISTFYVDPAFRRQEVGNLLLRNACQRWQNAGIHDVHITANELAAQTLGPLLKKYGFREICREFARYQSGRYEHVYQAHIPWLSLN